MFLLDNLALIALGWLNFIHHNLYWLGLFSSAFLLALNTGDAPKTKIFFAIMGIISTMPLGAYLLIPHLARFAGADVALSNSFVSSWLGCAVISWLGVMWWLRTGVRKVDVIAEVMTVKSTLERNKKTDVREMDTHRPTEALKFDVLKYLDKKKGVFLGLNEDEKEKYIEFGTGTSAPHVQVIGTTGAGKGVVLCIMSSQFLELGEAVFFCDPKNDEWAPSVLYAAAKRAGKPYHYINLNRPNGPQFNLFEGVTRDEAFELFLAGFGLTEKGDASDFYGIQDRRQAQLTADLMAKEKLTLAEAYHLRESELNDPESGAPKFAGLLREMAETPSINAKTGGVSLE